MSDASIALGGLVTELDIIRHQSQEVKWVQWTEQSPLEGSLTYGPQENCAPASYTSLVLVLFLSSVLCVPFKLPIGPLSEGAARRIAGIGEPFLAVVLQLSRFLLSEV
jgi:hypothetical protein